MSQPSTVDVPVAGRFPTRWVVIGGGVVAAVVVFAYWRRRHQTQPAYDPATGTPTEGGTYKNPVPGAQGFGPTVDNAPETIDTNDAWVRAAVADLAGLEWNAQFVTQALGNYLAGTGLSQDELNVVRAAWAVRGKPPQGAPEPHLAAPGQTNPPPPPPDQPAPPPPPSTIYEVAFAGTHSDEWINSMTQRFGTYWNQLVLWNPGIVGNITRDPIPANRKFIRTETYIVKKG